MPRADALACESPHSVMTAPRRRCRPRCARQRRCSPCSEATCQTASSWMRWTVSTAAELAWYHHSMIASTGWHGAVANRDNRFEGPVRGSGSLYCPIARTRWSSCLKWFTGRAAASGGDDRPPLAIKRQQALAGHQEHASQRRRQRFQGLGRQLLRPRTTTTARTRWRWTRLHRRKPRPKAASEACRRSFGRSSASATIRTVVPGGPAACACPTERSHMPPFPYALTHRVP